MIDKTEMEQAAIKAARQPFAEALTELGLMPHFEHRTAAEIDQLIEAAWNGCRASMSLQSARGEMPF